jgi:assimilatory nitrate reductase electron transfer subunit
VEVLQWADPVRHVYKKLVVRDGVVVGAVLLGDTSTAGAVTQAFDRRTPLAAERLHLLFTGLSAAAPPEQLDDDDLVCTCNGVSAGTVRACGARSLAEVAERTRATTGCGTCAPSVQALLSSRQPVPAGV